LIVSSISFAAFADGIKESNSLKLMEYLSPASKQLMAKELFKSRMKDIQSQNAKKAKIDQEDGTIDENNGTITINSTPPRPSRLQFQVSTPNGSCLTQSDDGNNS
jgi:hypothetical protein